MASRAILCTEVQQSEREDASGERYDYLKERRVGGQGWWLVRWDQQAGLRSLSGAGMRDYVYKLTRIMGG